MSPPKKKKKPLPNMEIKHLSDGRKIFPKVLYFVQEHLSSTFGIPGEAVMAAMNRGRSRELPSRIGPVILNDVGAHLEPDALDRIGSYVGKSGPFADWDEAAARIRRRRAPPLASFGEKKARTEARSSS